MAEILNVIKVIAPIFIAVFMGMLAKKKQLITPDENQGLQQYVMKFGLPCVLFNSCLTANLGVEALTSMVLILPLLLCSCLWAFHARKNRFPYHNLPMLFTAQESGMMGISLFATLFGSAQAYRMGVLDLTQSVLAIPVIAILAADTGKSPSLGYIIKQVIRSPLLLMSILGLAFNLSGFANLLNGAGILPIITEITGFLAGPVSAVILFSVGYNFSLSKDNRAVIFRISILHFALMLVCCAIVQAGLFLVPDTAPETRWAVLMFFTLPGSFIAPSLGKTEEESTVASGVCSLLTIVSLLVFCAIAIAVA